MTAPTVVIGLGNSFRRDDGLGPAAAAVIDSLGLPGVTVVPAVGDTLALIQAWTGADCAVVIDIALGGSTPGRLSRASIRDVEGRSTHSSHGVDVPAAFALSEVLDRSPRELIIITVDASDVTPGLGLSTEVATAVDRVVAQVCEVVREMRPTAACYGRRAGDKTALVDQ